MSCEIRKTKNWFYRNVSISLYAFALSLFISMNSIAEDDSENNIQHWFTEAEKYARSIEDTEECNWALSHLAVAYANAGLFTKAYLLARQLPHDNQSLCLHGIVMEQAMLGDITGALERTQNIRETDIKSGCLWSIAVVCAKTNIPMSLIIAEQISEPTRSRVFKRIAKTSVLKGNIKEAKNIVQQISDPNEKNDAQHWITAAEISEDKDIAKAIRLTHPFPEDLNFHLREIAIAKLQSGQIQKAEQIIESIPDSHNKIIGYLEIAEHYLGQDQRERFAEYMKKAGKELQQYPTTPGAVNFYEAMHYLNIAYLQIQAGDVEAGLNTIKIGLKKRQKDFSLFDFDLFDSETISFYTVSSVEKSAYELMVKAGKIEEVRKLAQRKDGSFPRDVAILLIRAYARAGQKEKADEIMNSLSTPKDKFHLSLAMIHGLTQRKSVDDKQP